MAAARRSSTPMAPAQTGGLDAHERFEGSSLASSALGRLRIRSSGSGPVRHHGVTKTDCGFAILGLEGGPSAGALAHPNRAGSWFRGTFLKLLATRASCH